jgi:hypothetical protein
MLIVSPAPCSQNNTYEKRSQNGQTRTLSLGWSLPVEHSSPTCLKTFSGGPTRVPSTSTSPVRVRACTSTSLYEYEYEPVPVPHQSTLALLPCRTHHHPPLDPISKKTASEQSFGRPPSTLPPFHANISLQHPSPPPRSPPPRTGATRRSPPLLRRQPTRRALATRESTTSISKRETSCMAGWARSSLRGGECGGAEWCGVVWRGVVWRGVERRCAAS